MEIEKIEMEERELEERTKALLNQARIQTPKAPEFLEARVLAHLEAKEKAGVTLGFWKRLAIGATAACAALVCYAYLATKIGVYEATAGKAVAVRVELNELSRQDVLTAAIDLPEGVSFYSQRYPQLHAERKLEIPSDALKGKSKLPFVVMASEAGEKTIQVSFYNKNRILILKRLITIRFDQPTNARG